MELPYSIITKSLLQTHQLVSTWVDDVTPLFQSAPTQTITLSGKVGAGKSVFVRQCLDLWKIFTSSQMYSSPSFNIINEYIVSDASPLFPIEYVYHIDLYHINSINTLENIGFFDIIDNNICFIEWPERINWQVPHDYTSIDIEILSEESRQFCFSQKNYTV